MLPVQLWIKAAATKVRKDHGFTENHPMKALLIVTAGALLMTSGAATAQSATDIKCMILSNVFAKNSKDAESQKAAEAALYFYLGRVPDGATSTQLKTLLDAQGKALTDATAGAMMNACVKTIENKVQMLQSLAPPPAKKPEGR
jgi:hypothetical protein